MAGIYVFVSGSGIYASKKVATCMRLVNLRHQDLPAHSYSLAPLSFVLVRGGSVYDAPTRDLFVETSSEDMFPKQISCPQAWSRNK